MNKKTIALLATCVALSACGVMREQLGFEKNSPDEMLVVSRAPLSVPPEFGLRPVVVDSETPVTDSTMSAGEKALLSKIN